MQRIHRHPDRPPDTGDPDALHAHLASVCAMPRALTGDGVRRFLTRTASALPGLRQVEVATGTEVLDWVIPHEWNLRRATLTAPDGRVVADTDLHPLHVVGHSEPLRATMSLADLDGHLHSLPDQPELIPWRTSYYRRTWGFCLPHRERQRLPDGDYEVQIDATLEPGHLTYGEAVLPGESDAEVLISAHTCHPAMANDNASGIVVAAAVARVLAALPTRRLTYRFLLAPGTIGAIAWLAANPEAVERTVGALVLSGVADPGPRFTYKASRTGDRPVDRAMALALRDSGAPHDIVGYSPWGYDERQFNSLGFDLGAGLLNRTPHGTYAEYHTSADTPEFVSGDHLAQAVDLVLGAIDVLERDGICRNLKPHGEPQLGPRGLWPATGGMHAEQSQQALLWVLALSDGQTPLSAIADRADLPFAVVADAASALAGTDLLEVISRGMLPTVRTPLGPAPEGRSSVGTS